MCCEHTVKKLNSHGDFRLEGVLGRTGLRQLGDKKNRAVDIGRYLKVRIQRTKYGILWCWKRLTANSRWVCTVFQGGRNEGYWPCFMHVHLYTIKEQNHFASPALSGPPFLTHKD